MKIDNWDDVFYIHSRNPYGNGTAIFTNNGATARKFQQEIDVGQVGTDIALYVHTKSHFKSVDWCQRPDPSAAPHDVIHRLPGLVPG